MPTKKKVVPKKKVIANPKKMVAPPKKVEPKGGFIWLSGWGWKGHEGFSFLDFGKGVEIRCLRMKRGSNELAVRLWSIEFDEGEIDMGYHAAKKRYPFMFQS